MTDEENRKLVELVDRATRLVTPERCHWFSNHPDLGDVKIDGMFDRREPIEIMLRVKNKMVFVWYITTSPLLSIKYFPKTIWRHRELADGALQVLRQQMVLDDLSDVV